MPREHPGPLSTRQEDRTWSGHSCSPQTYEEMDSGKRVRAGHDGESHWSSVRKSTEGIASGAMVGVTRPYWKAFAVAHGVVGQAPIPTAEAASFAVSGCFVRRGMLYRSLGTTYDDMPDCSGEASKRGVDKKPVTKYPARTSLVKQTPTLVQPALIPPPAWAEEGKVAMASSINPVCRTPFHLN